MRGPYRGWPFAVGLGRARVVREETPGFHETIQPGRESRRPISMLGRVALLAPLPQPTLEAAMTWSQLAHFLSAIDQGTGSDSAPPLTVVVGSGIHRMVRANDGREYDAQRMLSSWVGLLDTLADQRGRRPPDPALRWEMLALAYPDSPELTAGERDRRLQEKVRSTVSQAEEDLWKPGRSELAPLRVILQSAYVGDVISLNVDLTVERLVTADSSWNGDASGGTDLLRRHRALKRGGDAGTLRVWHPHGDRTNVESLSFGLWHYRNLLGPLDQARRKIKEAERTSEDKGMVAERAVHSPDNWLELLVFRPLLFVGTGLDAAEWDIWIGLLTRWRNFAQNKHLKWEHPVWILTVPGEHQHLPTERFRRLEGPEWSAAWSFLKNSFESRTG
jgi:hypothetical protein